MPVGYGQLRWLEDAEEAAWQGNRLTANGSYCGIRESATCTWSGSKGFRDVLPRHACPGGGLAGMWCVGWCAFT